jgi:hypothetical protein
MVPKKPDSADIAIPYLGQFNAYNLSTRGLDSNIYVQKVKIQTNVRGQSSRRVNNYFG